MTTPIKHELIKSLNGAHKLTQQTEAKPTLLVKPIEIKPSANKTDKR